MGRVSTPLCDDDPVAGQAALLCSALESRVMQQRLTSCSTGLDGNTTVFRGKGRLTQQLPKLCSTGLGVEVAEGGGHETSVYVRETTHVEQRTERRDLRVAVSEAWESVATRSVSAQASVVLTCTMQRGDRDTD